MFKSIRKYLSPVPPQQGGLYGDGIHGAGLISCTGLSSSQAALTRLGTESENGKAGLQNVGTDSYKILQSGINRCQSFNNLCLSDKHHSQGVCTCSRSTIDRSHSAKHHSQLNKHGSQPSSTCSQSANDAGQCTCTRSQPNANNTNGNKHVGRGSVNVSQPNKNHSRWISDLLKRINQVKQSAVNFCRSLVSLVQGLINQHLIQISAQAVSKQFKEIIKRLTEAESANAVLRVNKRAVSDKGFQLNLKARFMNRARGDILHVCAGIQN